MKSADVAQEELTPVIVSGTEAAVPATNQRRCLMWLGAQHELMNCDWIRAFDGLPEICMAFLFRSFGSENRCLLELMQDPRPKHLRVYLSQGTCIRKGNCSPLEAVVPSQIIDRAVDFLSFVDATCESCSVDIVPRLEDNLTHDEACSIGAQIRETFPFLGLRFQPIVSRNPLSPSDYNFDAPCFDSVELHGDTAAHFYAQPETECIYSNDGIDVAIGGTLWSNPQIMSEAEIRGAVEEKYSRCDSYIWTADSNCLTTDTISSPFPYDRQCTIDMATIEALNSLLLEL